MIDIVQLCWQVHSHSPNPCEVGFAIVLKEVREGVSIGVEV